LTTLRECAHEIGEVVQAHRGRGLSGDRATQYHLDVAADEVARRVLGGAGYRVVSEESGVTGTGEFTVVVDPIDGSTNCDRGVPFYSTSLAVLRRRRTRGGDRREPGDRHGLRSREGEWCAGATDVERSASQWPNRHV
jgi:fructose-1,6-bisphosphatase/inositol monophosphatase family enzyme